MRKNLFILLSLSLLVMACRDESDSFGVTPQDQCISQGFGCQDMYNGRSFYGSFAYPMYGQHYHGFENGIYKNVVCGPGTQPVASGVFGMGCLPQNLIPSSFSTYSIPVQGGQMALPMSCRSHNQCVSGHCITRDPFSPGICSR